MSFFSADFDDLICAHGLAYCIRCGPSTSGSQYQHLFAGKFCAAVTDQSGEAVKVCIVPDKPSSVIPYAVYGTYALASAVILSRYGMTVFL